MDLSKNCKDEENEGDTNEIKYSVDEKDKGMKLKRHKHLTEKEATITHHPGAATLKNEIGHINLNCSATSQSIR